MELKTPRQRLEYIISLKEREIDLHEAIELLNDKQLLRLTKKTILEKFFTALVNEDIKICINYDYIEENDWDFIISNYSTPGVDGEFKEIISQVSVFIEAFKTFHNFIGDSLEINIRDNTKNKRILGDDEKNNRKKIKLEESDNKTIVLNGEVIPITSLDEKSNPPNSVELKRNRENNYRNKIIANKTDPKTFIHMLLNIFDSHISAIKIKHTQYLIFYLAKNFPSIVFSFLLSKIALKNNHSKFYISYIFSLCVRCKINIEINSTREIVDSCIKKLVVIREKDDTNALLFLQGFIYLCCFRKKYYTGKIKKIIQNGISSRQIQEINEKVINVFSSTFDIDLSDIMNKKSVSSNKNEIADLFAFFPFDLPILDDITEMFDEYYIHFNKA